MEFPCRMGVQVEIRVSVTPLSRSRDHLSSSSCPTNLPTRPLQLPRTSNPPPPPPPAPPPPHLNQPPQKPGPKTTGASSTPSGSPPKNHSASTAKNTPTHPKRPTPPAISHST